MEHVKRDDDNRTDDAFVYSEEDDGNDNVNKFKRGGEEEQEEYVRIPLDRADDITSNTTTSTTNREEMTEAPIAVVHRMMRWSTSPSFPPCIVGLMQHPRASWHLLVALFVSLALLIILMSVRGG